MTDEPDDAEPLTVWEARQERIAKRALVSALRELGLDAAGEPLEIQQDLAWLRRRRQLEESTTAKFIQAILTFLVPGFVASFVATLLNK